MKVLIKCCAIRHLPFHHTYSQVFVCCVVRSLAALSSGSSPQTASNVARIRRARPAIRVPCRIDIPSFVVTGTWLGRRRKGPVAVKDQSRNPTPCKYHAARTHASKPSPPPLCVVRFEVCVPEPARSRSRVVTVLFSRIHSVVGHHVMFRLCAIKLANAW